MRNRCSVSLLVVTGIVACTAPPLSAHHAFAAEFDITKPVMLTGKVVKVEWFNPHARFYVEVRQSGRPILWELELSSPNGLIRQGWNRSSLKAGDVVRVKAYLAKDGSRLAAARGISYSNGRSVLVGPAGDGGPPE